MIQPKEKIKVFISSKCGEDKYDKIRADLKRILEGTGLFTVYLFEDEEASTLTAGQHYLWALQQVDVCIFLIDNLDNVSPGVQKEIDCAIKHKIKSLYYFCDENSKEKTITQQNLMGADKAKSKVVHSFEDLSKHGAQGIIDDISSIYKYYCKGFLNAEVEENEEISLSDNIISESSLIEKSIITNTDKCKQYFSKMFCPNFYKESIKNSSEIDEWASKFLTVLFEHKSIAEFNLSMFLNELKKFHNEEIFDIVSKRWEAIQLYYIGKLKECVEKLEETLVLAKEKNISDWLIKDILIDIRNYRQELFDMENKIVVDPASEEINSSKFSLFYPIMDRIKYNLFENIAEETLKEDLKSPHTMTLGYTITQTDMISDCYIVALFYGSLTHINLLHQLIKMLSFRFVKQFDNWNFRTLLLKQTIIGGNSKEVEGIQQICPDLLTKLDNKEANEIYDYCNCITIEHKQFKRKLQAMSIVGYFLDDESFDRHFSDLNTKINEWLETESPIFSIAEYIFNCLNKISHRVDMNYIANICIKFIEKNYSRWFTNVFKLISTKIDISKLNKDIAKNLIKCIETVLNYPNLIDSHLKEVLISFRVQDKSLTNKLDLLIKDKLPEFYEKTYKLETTVEKEEDIEFVKKYLSEIKHQNDMQGQNGIYYGFASFPHDTIRNILLLKKINVSDDLVDDIIQASCDTILSENQSIKTKCDAFDLILFLIQRSPVSIERNQDCLEQIKQSETLILTCPNVSMDFNITEIALIFSYNLLLTYLDKKNYVKIFEIIPYISDNVATQIQICKTTEKFLENDKKMTINTNLESIILQNVISWLTSNNLDIRWHCVKILFLLLRNDSLKDIINFQLSKLIDNDNCYIKNLIQNSTLEFVIDDKTKDYIKAGLFWIQ